MKKIIIFMFIFSLLIGIIGCSTKEEPAKDKGSATENIANPNDTAKETEVPIWNNTSLLDIAMQFSNKMGEASPSSIIYIDTTHGKSVKLFEDRDVQKDADVYNVVMHGNFKNGYKIFYLLVDKSNGDWTAYGFLEKDFDYSSLGKVVKLK